MVATIIIRLEDIGSPSSPEFIITMEIKAPTAASIMVEPPQNTRGEWRCISFTCLKKKALAPHPRPMPTVFTFRIFCPGRFILILPSLAAFFTS
jgi:hypothetical protein